MPKPSDGDCIAFLNSSYAAVAVCSSVNVGPSPKLERQGFGAVSDRAKKQQLAKINAAIEGATGELREARKADALASVEQQFGGVAA